MAPASTSSPRAPADDRSRPAPTSSSSIPVRGTALAWAAASSRRRAAVVPADPLGAGRVRPRPARARPARRCRAEQRGRYLGHEGVVDQNRPARRRTAARRGSVRRSGNRTASRSSGSRAGSSWRASDCSSTSRRSSSARPGSAGAGARQQLPHPRDTRAGARPARRCRSRGPGRPAAKRQRSPPPAAGRPQAEPHRSASVACSRSRRCAHGRLLGLQVGQRLQVRLDQGALAEQRRPDRRPRRRRWWLREIPVGARPRARRARGGPPPRGRRAAARSAGGRPRAGGGRAPLPAGRGPPGLVLEAEDGLGDEGQQRAPVAPSWPGRSPPACPPGWWRSPGGNGPAGRRAARC